MNRGLASKVGQKRPHFTWTDRRRRTYIVANHTETRWL